jgi:hypothetical protein
MSYAEHPARRVASKKGDLRYQGPKYSVVEYSSVGIWRIPLLIRLFEWSFKDGVGATRRLLALPPPRWRVRPQVNPSSRRNAMANELNGKRVELMAGGTPSEA